MTRAEYVARIRKCNRLLLSWDALQVTYLLFLVVVFWDHMSTPAWALLVCFAFEKWSKWDAIRDADKWKLQCWDDSHARETRTRRPRRK